MRLFGLPGDPADRIYEVTRAEDGTFYAAVFSFCKRYRYALARIWGPASGKFLVLVMLNPSKAHGNAQAVYPKADDATIRSCTRIAKAHGYAGIVVVNLFSLISTDPLGLKLDPDPVGPFGDEYLRNAAEEGHTVAVAWGSHAKIRDMLRPRAEAVLKLLRGSSRTVFAFGHNNDAQPKHPLYLPTTAELQPYWLQP